MLIIKSKDRGWFKPQYGIDLPMFMHCCEGAIEVRDIWEFVSVFNAHGVQIMIQDETYPTPPPPIKTRQGEV